MAMDRAEALTEGEASGAAVLAGACPRCGEPAGILPPVPTATLGGRSVRRCRRCGTRAAHGASGPEMIFTCEACGLPFSSTEILPHAEQRCPGCRSGSALPDLPDAMLASATEGEIRAALAARWAFVSAPRLSAYLDRTARQAALHVEGAWGESRVVLVSDPALRTLALPSGTLLVSLGMLAFLEDEAELVFVLGHETAHAASGDAAIRLVRLGFAALARGGEAPGREAWAGAALDLVRLGYGRHRERDADLRGLQAVLALGYDPVSVLRYLERLGALVEQGDLRVAELASAHPPPADRIRRIEKALYGMARGDRVLRTNREVFRRATGPNVFSLPLTPVSFGDVVASEEAPSPSSWPRVVRWAAITGAVLAAAAAVAWLLAL